MFSINYSLLEAHECFNWTDYWPGCISRQYFSIITTLLDAFRLHSNDHLQVTGTAIPTYVRRIGNGPRTARGAPPTRQMGVASDEEENRGSLGTKGIPPHLSSLPDKMLLTPRPAVTYRRTLPPLLLPVRIPWCVPVPHHTT